MNQRVLVVEDDSGIRRGIADALTFAGYEFLQAPNGNDGMAQGLRATFELLMLDLILPGPSGFEILKAGTGSERSHPLKVRVNGQNSTAVNKVHSRLLQNPPGSRVRARGLQECGSKLPACRFCKSLILGHDDHSLAPSEAAAESNSSLFWSPRATPSAAPAGGNIANPRTSTPRLAPKAA